MTDYVQNEHTDYDYVMAVNTVLLLRQVTDPLWRNVLHAACPIYIYNLLTWLNTDIDNFKQRCDDQVRSLTDRRTANQSEKLNNPDYEKAIDYISDLMILRGLLEKKPYDSIEK